MPQKMPRAGFAPTGSETRAAAGHEARRQGFALEAEEPFTVARELDLGAAPCKPPETRNCAALTGSNADDIVASEYSEGI
jgi:hypothetical protein